MGTLGAGVAAAASLRSQPEGTCHCVLGGCLVLVSRMRSIN